MTEYRNEITRTIFERRSTHHYLEKPVAREDLEFLVSCGIQAPNSRNLQPWFIACVQDKEILSAINKKTVEGLKEKDPFRFSKPGYSVFGNAPAVFFILGERSVTTASIDCAFLGGNMVLAAQSIGLSSCVMNQPLIAFEGSRKDALLDMLKAPFGYTVRFALGVGYSDSEGERKPKERTERCVVYL